MTIQKIEGERRRNTALTPEMMRVEEGLVLGARMSQRVKGPHQLDSFFQDHLLTNRNQQDEYPDPCKASAKLRPEALGVRPGEKIVVTEEGIDDWRAQLYGLRLQSLPTQKPDNVPEAVYDELKGKYLNRSGWKARSKSPMDANASRSRQREAIQQNSQSVQRLKKGGQGLALQVNNSLDLTKRTESSASTYINAPSRNRRILPTSYQTKSYNANRNVETLIQVLEPTPEQKARQDALQELKLAA